MSVLLCCWAQTLQAHDFWLEAHPFYQQEGKKVGISIHVGTDMTGDPLPNIPAWYTEFSYLSPDGRKPVQGELGREPAGYVEPDRPGVYVVGYHSRPEYVKMRPAKFNRYLKQEGLEKIIAERVKLNESDKESSEFYVRCVKTLVRYGTEDQIHLFQEPVGHPLEIIPLKDPYTQAVGDELTVKLLFNGKPLKDALVVAFTKRKPEQKQAVRTDRQGLATIDLKHAGVWLIKAVEMVRYDKAGADWISYWASMTFRL